MELPNGKGGKKKVASKRQRAASPAAPALEGGSSVEGEMAGELLAVPGPSGMCAGSGGSVPPVPVGESAATPAAMVPTVVELVVTELPPAVESEDMQPGVSAAGLLDVGLPELAAQAAAAAPAAEAVTAVRLVSEALSALDLTLGAGLLLGVPAAVEPAAATVTASAAEPAAVEGERPVLVDGSAAVSKEYWVLNSAVGPKVIPRDFLVGPTAAETAAASVEWAGEPVPESETPLAARQAACEAEDSPVVTASGPKRQRRRRRQSRGKQRLGCQEGHKRGRSPPQLKPKTCK
jgi:hypothetical protein